MHLLYTTLDKKRQDLVYGKHPHKAKNTPVRKNRGHLLCIYKVQNGGDILQGVGVVATAGLDANGDGNVILLTILEHQFVILLRAADRVRIAGNEHYRNPGIKKFLEIVWIVCCKQVCNAQ